jgi:acyl dehydratase
MGATAVSLRFLRPPAVLRYYPRAVLARRAATLPDGATVPRMEGEVASIRVSSAHLGRYRKACGFEADACLPISYPHVLAMPLHIALLTHPAFVVRLMGLVHIANEIVLCRPLRADGEYGLRCRVEGHDETDRGQEFGLCTELLDRDGVAWQERSTLLARLRASSGAQASRSVRASLRAPRPPAGVAATEVPLRADHATARRYGRVSGDLNPIHLADFSARWYGFDKAVAHGMWSMARSLSALGPALSREPCRVPVEFKMPLFLPSAVILEHWQDAGTRRFVLRDGVNRRPHLAGSVEPA